MMNGLQRRYSLVEIETQAGNQITPRLNYNALQTLRNPLYVKMGQQIQEDSKIQQTTIIKEIQRTHQISEVASHAGVNAQELEQILTRLGEKRSNEQASPEQKEKDIEMPPANDGGGEREAESEPMDDVGSSSAASIAVGTNIELNRIAMEKDAEIERLKADYKLKYKFEPKCIRKT